MLSSLAIAAEPRTADRGASSFRRGYQKYNLGEYREALEEFKKAYEAGGAPSHLFNIAQCHRKLGQLREALASYQAFLREPGRSPQRAQAERLVRELELELAKAAPIEPVPSVVPSVATTPAPAPSQPPPDLQPALPDGRANQIDLSQAAPPPEKPAFYRRPWFWTAAGAVVLAGVATAFLVGRSGGGAGDPCVGVCGGGTFTVPR